MTEQTKPIVEIRNLYKSYQRESLVVPVLFDITFDIAAGEFLALMGPSGSGKTTLLNLIAGIDRADSGSIHVGDIDITTLTETELAAWRANSVGFIFQFYNLIPVLQAVENVELPLHLTVLTKKQRREHAQMALSMVGLAHRMDHYPGEMSGGEQQRVAIARALLNNPSLILADEPTGNLDSKTSSEVMNIFKSLNEDKGITMVMVTHEPDIAAWAGKRIYLKDGLIVREETS